MTKREWFLLFASVAFLVSTGRLISKVVELKTSGEDVFPQALTVRI
jgi:uncharacterized membrane-anchored protein